MVFVNELIGSLASSPLVLVAVFLVVVIDGFFPPIPSETVVVAVAAIGMTTGLPEPWLVIATAAAGSFVGDNIAYLLGRRVNIAQYRWMRAPRVMVLLDRAGHSLLRRPTLVILTARFIPIGRVAVNIIAGATRLPRQQFYLLTAISAVVWASYSAGVGLLAGWWIKDNPLLGSAVGVAVALLVGLFIDRIRRANQPGIRDTGDAAQEPKRLRGQGI